MGKRERGRGLERERGGDGWIYVERDGELERARERVGVLERESDPKRIQRRLRIAQNSQRELRTLRMAPTHKEREKIQISQN